MKHNAWKILALLALAFSAHADFFLWLDSPSRSNPNDPKSPFYHGAVTVPLFVPSNTPTISPTFTVSNSFTVTPALTATPSFSVSPTPSATTGAASNGSWPMLTNFNADITNNSAAGTNDVAWDGQDGCGASASSASMASSNASPFDATPFMRVTYNVATNASCGYQYASVAFPFSTHDLTGKTSVDFAIRSTAVVRLMIKTASVDACLGSKNKMWIDIPSTGGAWQTLSEAFSAMSIVNAGCPYPLNDVAFVSFAVENVGSGTLDLDNISLGNTPPASPTPTATPAGSNGAWPVLSSFNFDISGNNAGGTNSVANDNDDGCGVSASSASVAASNSSPFDATQFLRMTYNVAVNASCGYQYASAAFPFSTHDLTGMTGIDLAIRSTAAVRVMIRTAAVDGCLGVKNKMWFDIPSTGGAWQSVSQAFSGFSLVNAGCPYPLNDVAFISFNIENPGSGTVDLDNITFTSGAVASSTPSDTPTQVFTSTDSPTSTPTLTCSMTGTITGTVSPMTATPTRTASPSPSATPSNTPGVVNTPSSSPTPTSTATATNGNWPTLSTFDLDIINNNAGGIDDVGNDNQDGCGASTSSASIAQSMASPINGTPFERMTYNVGTNAGCGYQYASMSFTFATHNLLGKTSIDFAIRSTATVRIMFRTAGIDACLGSKNKMWIDVPSTGGVWAALNKPFNTFSLVNAGCPYPLNDVAFVAFSVENPGSGTVDLDNVSFP